MKAKVCVYVCVLRSTFRDSPDFVYFLFISCKFRCYDLGDFLNAERYFAQAFAIAKSFGYSSYLSKYALRSGLAGTTLLYSFLSIKQELYKSN